ncbi:uncharacterized protein [Procambarus clarkii]|uniref:uncharacterized protein n=1 Tax=Procambarus clarkii TaxID=6728 RepID=UPI0037422876
MKRGSTPLPSSKGRVSRSNQRPLPASQYAMASQYNMEDIRSALNAICPGSASGLDANSSFDLNLYLETLPDIPLFCDGEGAAGGVNGPPEAASASGYSAQSHLPLEGSAFGYNTQSHLPLEGSASGYNTQSHLPLEGSAFGYNQHSQLELEGSGRSWDRQSHLAVEGSAFGYNQYSHLPLEGSEFGYNQYSHLPLEGSVPSWERQSQLVPEGSASGWGASSHLGLGEAPSPTWQHNDYLRMVDPNEVLRTPATEDHQLCQGPQLLPHDPTALHYPSTTLNSFTDSSECCLFPQDDMSREQHSVYPQESEHSAYSPGTLSGATASPYSSNLPAGTPPLRSSSSALEAVLGARTRH